MTKILARQIEHLITQGEKVVKSRQPRGDDSFVDSELLVQWRGTCRALVATLGTRGEPWQTAFKEDNTSARYMVQRQLAQLKSIADSLELGLLSRIEDLVYNQAFQDLMDQADELLDNDRVLPAAVVLRAVLEERLKVLCERGDCVPSKSRPTITDYRTSLKQAEVIDATTGANIESMAAVGNHAAHNKPDLRRDDVVRFRRDLGEFLNRFAA